MRKRFKGENVIDDCLDDEVEPTGRRVYRTRPGKKGPPHERIAPLDINKTNATVIEVLHKACRVRLDSEPTVPVLCHYRRASVYRNIDYQGFRERSPVAVGDRVKTEAKGGQDFVIDGVGKRKNQLLRPAPGRDEKLLHVIAANIDQVVIVASVSDPEFSPGLIDRYLVACQYAKLDVVICINKTDLLESAQESPWAMYEAIGVRCLKVSAKLKQGIENLQKELLGKTAVFCGHSGVGKTSLLRALLETDIGKIGELNEFTKKGKHTTTSAILYEGPLSSHGKSYWIDTPGIRAFGLLGINPGDLSQFFVEFSDAKCGTPHCQHWEELDCAVRSFPRYDSYRRIMESLLSGES